MSDQFYFETRRCYVRAFKEKDLDVFVSYRNNMDWMIHQSYKGLTKEVYKSQLVRKFDINDGGQLAFLKKENGLLLGDLYLVKNGNEISIGYTIHPHNARLGYVEEVVTKLLKVLIRNYPECKIIADTTKNNIPSIKLLEKLGFKSIETTENEICFEFTKG